MAILTKRQLRSRVKTIVESNEGTDDKLVELAGMVIEVLADIRDRMPERMANPQEE